MKFRQYLNEMAMRSEDDLPDEVVVVRRSFAGGHGVIVYYADRETLQETEEDGNWSWPTKPHGMLHMHLARDGIFQLSEVYASEGWGPLLHDLAIEYATAHGKGMMCDPREMSGDAIGVFTYYFQKRGDVQKEMAPPGMVPPKYSSHLELQYVYRKPDQARTQDMRTNEQLIEYN